MRALVAFPALLATALAGSGDAIAAPGSMSFPAAAPSDMLLFAAQFENTTLSEALPAHGDPADPLLPVDELSRLLELNITVLPGQGFITGRLGESEKPLTIDLASGEARSGSIGMAIRPTDAVISPTDIFIRASLLQKLFPISIKVDADSLLLTIFATEKLPLQMHRERSERLLRLKDAPAIEADAMHVASPYRWVGYPAFDFTADIGGDSERGGFNRRFEARVAADLLRTDVSGVLNTDDTGHLSSARIKAERRSLTGNLLGPLHATYAAAGDVYSPALSLGPRSIGGAGAVFSTGRLEQASVFERINLRGELPQGFDVELYVNDILRAGQNTAAQGRYEFLDVPLVRGVNVVRIVSYGPHGQREEQTRVVNVGGGQVEKGKAVIDAGIVWQDRPVIALGGNASSASGLATGKPRAVVSLAYGLTSTLTINAGGALYADQFGKMHQLLMTGLRTSLGGFALQADHANDFAGGSAVSLGAWPEFRWWDGTLNIAAHLPTKMSRCSTFPGR
jgi:hypothetical protein